MLRHIEHANIRGLRIIQNHNNACIGWLLLSQGSALVLKGGEIMICQAVRDLSIV